MKKSFIYILSLMPLLTMAQVDRTKAPAPAPAPEIKIGQPVTYVLPNGLRVFVVKNTKLPRVSATLTMDMDGILEGNKAGLTSMAGTLLRRGTTTMNKAQLDEEVDFLGGTLNTSSTGVSASSLKNNFNKLFALMSDVVLRPSFPASELEKIRKPELSSLEADKDDPNTIAENVANRLVYGKNHPYGDIATEQTINNIKLEDIKNYFKTYWKPNNAFLVFVGDIAPDEAKALATKYFGSWARGVVPKATFKMPEPPAKTYIAIVDRPASVQSIITTMAPVPLKPGSPDDIPSNVMNSILGGGSTGRLFLNLREKHGFTYGAYSSLRPDRLVGAFSAEASVRNEKTDSAISELLSEFRTIRSNAVPDTDVVNMKNFQSGNFARSLENPATIANFALNIARYNLPASYYRDYLKNLGAVDQKAVMNVATKYVNPDRMHIIIVGNAKQIAPGLEKYGEVKYFDVYGNETAPPKVVKVQSGVTAESILKKAVAASGSDAARAAIKDIELNGEASVMGRTITISQKHILPSIFSFTMQAGPMTLQKQMFKDGKYTVISQGMSQEADAEDKEEIDEKLGFFTEAYMLNKPGYKFTLGDVEQVKGKDAYAVNITTPAGREFTDYYDLNTGLKLKTSTVEDGGPMGKVTVQVYFADYKNFNGVQIPTVVSIDQGPIKIEMNFKDIKVNSGLKAEDIK